jgi:hypothetical protein
MKVTNLPVGIIAGGVIAAAALTGAFSMTHAQGGVDQVPGVTATAAPGRGAGAGEGTAEARATGIPGAGTAPAGASAAATVIVSGSATGNRPSPIGVTGTAPPSVSVPNATLQGAVAATIPIPGSSNPTVSGSVTTPRGVLTVNTPGALFGTAGGAIQVSVAGNVVTIAASTGAAAAGRVVEVCLDNVCQTVTLGVAGTASFTLPGVMAGGPRPGAAVVAQAPRGPDVPVAVRALPATGTSGPPNPGTETGIATLLITAAVLSLMGAAAWIESRFRG